MRELSQWVRSNDHVSLGSHNLSWKICFVVHWAQCMRGREREKGDELRGRTTGYSELVPYLCGDSEEGTCTEMYTNGATIHPQYYLPV